MTGFVLFWLLIVGIIYSLKSFEEFKECREESENCGYLCDCEKNDLLCAYECLQCVDKKQLDCCIYLFNRTVCENIRFIKVSLKVHESQIIHKLRDIKKMKS